MPRLLLAILAGVNASSVPEEGKRLVKAKIEFKGEKITCHIGFRNHSLRMLRDDVFGPDGHEVTLAEADAKIYDDDDAERGGRILYLKKDTYFIW